MRVFITGGSGFVGQEIIRQLSDSGHHVRALVRNPDRLKEFPDIDKVRGDATCPETLQGSMSGCDAVIHLVGIIREVPSKGVTFERLHTQATANVIAACKEHNIKRYLHMSANGTRMNAATQYHRTKWQAEELVTRSGLDWTIFRPSLIFGPADAFINMLAKMIRLLPVLPVFGDGKYSLQPVHVRDVAKSFVAALTRSDCIGQTYHCCGPDIVSYNELLDIISKALGKKSPACKLHHPLWLMRPIISAFESISLFPITQDQLTMLLEGNRCDDDRWSETFGIEATSLVESIKEYLP